MRTKKIAIATTIGAATLMVLLFALPAMAASTSNTTTSRSQRADLVLGQSITMTSISGGYKELGKPSVNGTATGSLSLQVTGVFKGGYALAVTGGTLSFGGATYTISGGSAELGPYGVHMVGQAQAGSSAQLLFAARNLGAFGTSTYGVLRVDLTSVSNEFGVKLLVSIATS